MRAALLGLCIGLVGLSTPAAAGPLRQADQTLSVSVSGSGRVTSNPSGISCTGQCSAMFKDRSSVTLNQSAGQNWSFAGWGGDCSGTGSCQVLMSGSRRVTATFHQGPPPPPPPPQPKPKFTLTVMVTGVGSVAGNPAGIACGADCTQDYDSGASVTLAPFPGAASGFVAWGGDCTGAGLCTVTMNTAKNVTATFSSRKAPTPQTRPTPNAGGIVNHTTVRRPFHLTVKFLCYSRNELFLVRLYQDVLKRPIGPGELALLSAKLAGGTSPADVALTVLRSLEYRTLLIQGFYSAFLHRAAAPTELVAGLATLGGGTRDEELEAALLGSAEYFITRGGGTNSGFLDAVFQDLLGRAPTSSERSALSGLSGTQVARQVLDSAERRTKLVQQLFDRFLGRPATDAEVSPFLAQLGGGGSDEQVAAAILGSAEYLTKAGEYAGTILWGDGSSTPGTLAHAGKRCTFSGDHTYAKGGDLLVKVDVKAPDGGVTTLTRLVQVAGAGGAVGPSPGTPPPSGKENVQATGKVLIKVKGKFVPLTGFKQVPFGTELDVTKGTVKLTSHDGSTGTFYQGRFKLLPGLDTPVPGKPSKRVTEIVMTGGSFASCAARTAAGTAKPKPKKSVRHVWGNAKGNFRTKGRYAAATVRGTLWRTDDLCDGTLVSVKRGKVDVFDRVKRKHVLVPAGRSYLAKS